MTIEKIIEKMYADQYLEFLSDAYGFTYHLEYNPVGMCYNLTINADDRHGFWSFPYDDESSTKERIAKIVHEFFL